MIPLFWQGRVVGHLLPESGQIALLDQEAMDAMACQQAVLNTSDGVVLIRDLEGRVHLGILKVEYDNIVRAEY